MATVATSPPALGSFLKWVGGKTRYAQFLCSMAPDYDGIFREPFMGSAAVFFELRPNRAVLTDANPDLVVAFQQVASDPHAVMRSLDDMVNTREEFARIRSLDPEKMVALDRAARLIYLNKTAFRGLWRVNKRGHFNTPWGAYDRPLYNSAQLLAASKTLQSATIARQDFEEAIGAAMPGDFVFLDPPYVPLGGWSDFKRYTPEQFGVDDHERLAAAMHEASGRGVYILMTNSDVPVTRKLFRGFETATMSTRRDVNLNAADRRSVDLLVANFELRPREPLLF